MLPKRAGIIDAEKYVDARTLVSDEDIAKAPRNLLYSDGLRLNRNEN